MRPVLFFILTGSGISCVTVKQVTQTTANIGRLNLIGQYVIPYDLKYNGTTVGGLSGIDYDAKNKWYYLISDDRSDKNPARFYKARIYFTPRGIDTLVFISVKNMLRPDGTIYPGNKTDSYHTPDPEAIRYDPVNKQLVWSSEGERLVTEKDSLLQNPSVSIIRPN